MSVSEKLQVLKETYPDGKEFVLVLDKLLDSALSDHRLRLTRYDRELKEFEQRFGMTSAILSEKFEAGEVGDTMDYFEWASLYELQKDLVAKISRLNEIQ